MPGAGCWPGWASPATAWSRSGWACLLLAAFYAMMEVRGWKGWAFPLVVVGMNSIAMYCLTHLESGFIADTLKTHLGQQWPERVSPVYAPIIEQSAVLFVLWLAMLWLYRRKLFLRI